MDEKHARLFQRIREKCQQRRWYGPDTDDPFAIQRQIQASDLDYIRGWYDQDGKEYHIGRNTNLSSLPIPADFAYPPATEEQLYITEQSLGFALPSLLRDLYANVANGGFGPVYGLYGVAGGFGNTINYSYIREKRNRRLVDISLYERRQPSWDPLQLPHYVHPEYFIEICDFGCGLCYYLDCATERVFLGGWNREFYGLHLEAASLYEWLDRWVVTL